MRSTPRRRRNVTASVPFSSGWDVSRARARKDVSQSTSEVSKVVHFICVNNENLRRELELKPSKEQKIHIFKYDYPEIVIWGSNERAVFGLISSKFWE